jgi:hypothetical protein
MFPKFGKNQNNIQKCFCIGKKYNILVAMKKLLGGFYHPKKEYNSFFKKQINRHEYNLILKELSSKRKVIFWGKWAEDTLTTGIGEHMYHEYTLDGRKVHFLGEQFYKEYYFRWYNVSERNIAEPLIHSIFSYHARGVYGIYTGKTHRIYIGKAALCTFCKRWEKHLRDLQAGIHHNKKMQNNFDETKIFVPFIIEGFICDDLNIRRERTDKNKTGTLNKIHITEAIIMDNLYQINTNIRTGVITNSQS